MKRILTFLCLAALAFGQGADFFLKDGDRVVFYGDSITDQRLYTAFAETFVLTRYPGRKITFVHSGWGGDRVTGGPGGPVDVRLTRDVYPYKPNVVTIMLGMNDGRYRSYDQAIYDTYASGLESMVKQMKATLPGVRITAIRPSPYDEVTRPLMQPTGYNTVLVQFGNYIAELAKREGLSVADLNAPVVAMLERAKATDPEGAGRIIADRVHPGAAGHLIMAGALLRAWGAQGRVSAVEIDAKAAAVKSASRAKVTGLNAGVSVAWTQVDESLPMPVDWDDPVTKLAVNSSDFLNALNRQDLKVTGLAPGWYALRIDGQQVTVLKDTELAAGVNLARYPTPMMKQASDVHALTVKHNNVHFARWRSLQVPLANDGAAKLAPAMAALDALEEELVARQRAAAQPAPHQFELTAVPETMRNIPDGFTPVFNGKDLTGWHISKTNHHGQTQAWKVEDGAITGAQDKPGHGGILLTDRKYKNFEVYIEVKPDWGCDGGLFLRSSEKGEAYQVMLDYLEGGSVGGIYGEALQGVRGEPARTWRDHWRNGDWNAIRARIEGDTPRIRVWMNGAQVVDWTDTANHLPGGAVEGMIAVQVHMGNRWADGGKHRFRNIAVRELP